MQNVGFLITRLICLPIAHWTSFHAPEKKMCRMSIQHTGIAFGAVNTGLSHAEVRNNHCHFDFVIFDEISKTFEKMLNTLILPYIWICVRIFNFLF